MVGRDEEVAGEAVGLVFQQIVIVAVVNKGFLLRVKQQVCRLMKEREPEEVVLLIAIA